jgi:nitrogen fixation NifU-like protein
LSAPLYGDVIADHARNPRHRGTLESPDAAYEGVNPLCGDRVRIELRIRDRRIDSVRFEASACMVSVAAASILGGLVDGIAVDSARSLSDGDLLAALRTELRPSRVGCALLPLQALRSALETVQ